MQLTFKNQHIFWAVTDRLWDQVLDYRFKAHINALVAANPADNYEQTVTLGLKELLAIFNEITVEPEGEATDINNEMKVALLPQLMAQSNLAAVQAATAALQAWQVEVYQPWVENVLTPWELEHEEGDEPPVAPNAPEVPEPNEAGFALIQIQAITNKNKASRLAKIAKRKQRIMA